MFAFWTAWEILTVSGSNMVPTLAVPTPYGCIGCKLPQPNYPPALITLMFCLMVVTVVTDLTGNSLVILAVGKSKKLRNSGKLPFLLSIQQVRWEQGIYGQALTVNVPAPNFLRI